MLNFRQVSGIFGFTAVLTVVFYPIFISPFVNPKPWRKQIFMEIESERVRIT